MPIKEEKKDKGGSGGGDDDAAPASSGGGGGGGASQGAVDGLSRRISDLKEKVASLELEVTKLKLGGEHADSFTGLAIKGLGGLSFLLLLGLVNLNNRLQTLQQAIITKSKSS